MSTKTLTKDDLLEQYPYVDDLKNYATIAHIDLGGATRKDDIVDAILAHYNASANGQEAELGDAGVPAPGLEVVTQEADQPIEDAVFEDIETKQPDSGIAVPSLDEMPTQRWHLLPTYLQSNPSTIIHIARNIVENDFMADGWNNLSIHMFDEYMLAHFEIGYTLKKIEVVGYHQNGISLVATLQKTETDPALEQYTQFHFVTRGLVAGQGTILTNEYISDFVDRGWKVFDDFKITAAQDGLFMGWVLVQ